MARLLTVLGYLFIWKDSQDKEILRYYDGEDLFEISIRSATPERMEELIQAGEQAVEKAKEQAR